ncbi:putative pre-rRNA-processing protein RIX1 [Helianthus annuus]|nr:putative pre-rRNA-processing protein RIX1 [Helianthus annuus]
MAAFDYAQNLYDVALKPRLLRSLINEHIPEDKQPLGDSLRLLHVASAIRTHELLSERVVPSADNKKLIEKWKSAVDLWVDRVLMLVFSKMPDKAWAGISLLGVTFEVCSSERFLASYSVWFQELLKHIQASAGSNFVKLACCASISDFLTRYMLYLLF